MITKKSFGSLIFAANILSVLSGFVVVVAAAAAEAAEASQADGSSIEAAAAAAAELPAVVNGADTGGITLCATAFDEDDLLHGCLGWDLDSQKNNKAVASLQQREENDNQKFSLSSSFSPVAVPDGADATSWRGDLSIGLNTFCSSPDEKGGGGAVPNVMFTVYPSDSFLVESIPADLVSMVFTAKGGEDGPLLGFKWNPETVKALISTAARDDDPTAVAAGVKIGIPADQLRSVTVWNGNQAQILDGFTSVRHLTVLDYGEEEKDEGEDGSLSLPLASLRRLTSPTTLWATFAAASDANGSSIEDENDSSSASPPSSLAVSVRGRGSQAHVTHQTNTTVLTGGRIADGGIARIRTATPFAGFDVEGDRSELIVDGDVRDGTVEVVAYGGGNGGGAVVTATGSSENVRAVYSLPIPEEEEEAARRSPTPSIVVHAATCIGGPEEEEETEKNEPESSSLTCQEVDTEMPVQIDTTELPFKVTGFHRRCSLDRDDDEEEEGEDAEDLLAVVKRQYYEEIPPDDEEYNYLTNNTVWNYENGLLVANAAAAAGEEDAKLCLGLDASSYPYLKEKSCRPYPLTLQDCPPSIPGFSDTDAEEEGAVDTDSSVASSSSSSRHMRFLLTEEGQIRSLAPVLDRKGNDVFLDRPYCLTVIDFCNAKDDENPGAYLKPCREEEGEENKEAERAKSYYNIWGFSSSSIKREKQFFSLEGSSEPFLLPLQARYGYDDEVELAYHTGLSSSGGDNDGSGDAVVVVSRGRIDFFVTALFDDGENDLLVDSIEINDEFDDNADGGGIIRFVPSDHGVSGGSVTAKLVVENDSNEEEKNSLIAEAKTTFEVDERLAKTSSCRGYGYYMSDQDTRVFVGLAALIICTVVATLVLRVIQTKRRARRGQQQANDDEEDGKTVPCADAETDDEESAVTDRIEEDDERTSATSSSSGRGAEDD